MQKIKFLSNNQILLNNQLYQGYTIGELPNTFGFIYNEDQDMITQIDEYVDNREVYKIKRDLSTNAASEFYKTLTYKGD